METSTPYAYLSGGPVPVNSAVKDPRMVSLSGDFEFVDMAAADGSGTYRWRRTERIRSVEGLDLHVYAYDGPSPELPSVDEVP